MAQGFFGGIGDIAQHGFAPSPPQLATLSLDRSAAQSSSAQLQRDAAAGGGTPSAPASTAQPSATPVAPTAPSHPGPVLNTPQTVRRPRYSVNLNGNVVADSTRVSIESQNNYSADRCTLTIVVQPNSATGFAWYEAQANVTIEIRIGDDDADPSSWPVLFAGNADDYSLHYSTNIIEISARDYSAKLMDDKTAETFSNRTSSEIVKILAARHGLTADVQDTSTPVGEYYKAEHDKIVLGSFHKSTTEWHLLVYLAQQEAFDIWMTGSVLHFRPAVSESDKPYLVSGSYDQGIFVSNINDLRLSRDFTKSKDIKVEVSSWNSKQKTKHVYTAGGGSSGTKGAKGSKGEPGSAAQTYTYIIPGLSAAQAQAEANKRLAYLTKLERRVSFSEPGNLDYNIRNLIKLSGTASDGVYYIDHINREIGFDGGFMQTVTAKNHSKPAGDGNVG